MVLDGYHSITNVDYSPVVIERMRELHDGVLGLRYVLADCRRASSCAQAFKLSSLFCRLPRKNTTIVQDLWCRWN